MLLRFTLSTEELIEASWHTYATVKNGTAQQKKFQKILFIIFVLYALLLIPPAKHGGVLFGLVIGFFALIAFAAFPKFVKVVNKRRWRRTFSSQNMGPITRQQIELSSNGIRIKTPISEGTYRPQAIQTTSETAHLTILHLYGNQICIFPKRIFSKPKDKQTFETTLNALIKNSQKALPKKEKA